MKFFIINLLHKRHDKFIKPFSLFFYFFFPSTDNRTGKHLFQFGKFSTQWRSSTRLRSRKLIIIYLGGVNQEVCPKKTIIPNGTSYSLERRSSSDFSVPRFSYLNRWLILIQKQKKTACGSECNEKKAMGDIISSSRRIIIISEWLISIKKSYLNLNVRNSVSHIVIIFFFLPVYVM